MAESAPASGGLGHIPALDGLRAVAVLAVIGYHWELLGLRGGFLGVDLFFVLSGFLITSLLAIEWNRDGRIGLAGFWSRRLRRLMPASLLMLAVVAIWVNVSGDEFQVASWRDDLWATLGYVANWRFVVSGQSYFDLYSDASPVRHAWSLAIEEQFYFLWPVIVFVAFRLGRGRRLPLGLLAAAGIIASGVLMWALHDPGDPSRAYYGTDTRAGQLLIGAVLGLVLAGRTEGRTHRIGWFAAPALGVVLASMWILQDTSEVLYRGGFSVFSVVVAALIAAVVVSPGAPVAQMLSWRPLRAVGAVSYGLYLWHWPVQIAVSPQRFDLQPWAITAIRAAVTVAFTVASYWLIETPVRRRRSWGALPGWRAVVATVVAVALAGAAIGASARRSTERPDFLAVDDGAVIETPVVTAPPGGAGADLGTVILVGDSIAASFQDAAALEAGRRGMGFGAATRPGCSLIGGLTLRSDGVPYPWSQPCLDQREAFIDDKILAANPTTIVWFSSWESASRLVDGVVHEPGKLRFDWMLYREIDKTVERLTRNGAKVVLVTVPGRAVPNEIDSENPRVDALMIRQNAVYHAYAYDHPDKAMVMALDEIMCPDGAPCPQVVDGIIPRPRDGGHFEGDGPDWMSRILFDWLEANALRDEPSTPAR